MMPRRVKFGHFAVLLAVIALVYFLAFYGNKISDIYEVQAQGYSSLENLADLEDDTSSRATAKTSWRPTERRPLVRTDDRSERPKRKRVTPRPPHVTRPFPRTCRDVQANNTDYRKFCSQIHARTKEAMPDFQQSEGLPIRRGTVLYLVQGEDWPSPFWTNVSLRADSYLLWLSWRERVPSVIREKTFLGYIYYPKSAFNRGRNRLLKRALKEEASQGWKFEFFVFADEDQEKMTVPKLPYDMRKKHFKRLFSANATVRALAYPRSVATLNHLLFLYRPARAGIHLQHPETDKPPFYGCVTTPSIDMALEAFHRTVMAALMPYNSKFDDDNIWFSTPVMNLAAQTFLGPFSVQFRQIISHTDSDEQKHANYPREYSFEKYRHDVYCYMKRCLAVSALRADQLLPDEGTDNLIIAMATREVEPPHCLRVPKTVDYSTIFNPALIEKNWLQPVD